MNQVQLYLYILGIVSFFCGCFIYYQIKKNNKYSETQILNRKRLMNIILVTSFVFLVFSWL